MIVTPEQANAVAALGRRLGTMEVNPLHGNNELLRVDIPDLLPRIISPGGDISILRNGTTFMVSRPR